MLRTTASRSDRSMSVGSLRTTSELSGMTSLGQAMASRRRYSVGPMLATAGDRSNSKTMDTDAAGNLSYVFHF